MRILAQGLIDLGILKVSLDEALDPDRLLHRRYTLHGVSHMLGLDVHDCANAREEEYRYGRLREGMVLTVEPGLYFQPDDATVPERFRGIGVRIEDDIAVTSDGAENLSAAITLESRRSRSLASSLGVPDGLLGRRHDRRARRGIGPAVASGQHGAASRKAASSSSIGQRPNAKITIQISWPTPGTKLSSDRAPLNPALAKIRQ